MEHLFSYCKFTTPALMLTEKVVSSDKHDYKLRDDLSKFGIHLGRLKIRANSDDP